LVFFRGLNKQKTGGIKEGKKLLINIHSELSDMNYIIPFLTYYGINLGYFLLDCTVKIGYYGYMLRYIVLFVLRLSLIVMFWAFVWRFVEPKTQFLRVIRAALLVLGLLAILAMLRITGQ